MTLPTRHRTAETLRAAAPLLALAPLAAVLLRLPPEQHSFYPRCPVYEYLHLQCPGCGATRALAALLRGHLREAIHLNALFTLMLPSAALYRIFRKRRLLPQEASHRTPPPAAIYAALGVAAVFTILRNLPHPPL